LTEYLVRYTLGPLYTIVLFIILIITYLIIIVLEIFIIIGNIYYKSEFLFSLIREESICGRKLYGTTERQNIYIICT